MNQQRNNRSDTIFDWWFWTVILTFFPLICLTLMDLCADGKLELNKIFGDGELILSSFLVIIPSINKLYSHNSINLACRRMFCVLLFLAMVELISYVSIKMNDTRQLTTVYIVSFFSMATSIIMGHACEKMLCKEVVIHA